LEEEGDHHSNDTKWEDNQGKMNLSDAEIVEVREQETSERRELLLEL